MTSGYANYKQVPQRRTEFPQMSRFPYTASLPFQSPWQSWKKTSTICDGDILLVIAVANIPSLCAVCPAVCFFFNPHDNPKRQVLLFIHVFLIRKLRVSTLSQSPGSKLPSQAPTQPPSPEFNTTVLCSAGVNSNPALHSLLCKEWALDKCS